MNELWGSVDSYKKEEPPNRAPFRVILSKFGFSPPERHEIEEAPRLLISKFGNIVRLPRDRLSEIQRCRKAGFIPGARVIKKYHILGRNLKLPIPMDLIGWIEGYNVTSPADTPWSPLRISWPVDATHVVERYTSLEDRNNLALTKDLNDIQ